MKRHLDLEKCCLFYKYVLRNVSSSSLILSHLPHFLTSHLFAHFLPFPQFSPFSSRFLRFPLFFPFSPFFSRVLPFSPSFCLFLPAPFPPLFTRFFLKIRGNLNHAPQQLTRFYNLKSKLADGDRAFPIRDLVQPLHYTRTADLMGTMKDIKTVISYELIDIFKPDVFLQRKLGAFDQRFGFCSKS